jgi:hypothetical protein
MQSRARLETLARKSKQADGYPHRRSGGYNLPHNPNIQKKELTMNANNKVFKTFLKVKVNGAVMEIPIYPRSTKKTFFTNIKSAVKRLESVAKRFYAQGNVPEVFTGIVYQYQNGERVANVHQIVL